MEELKPKDQIRISDLETLRVVADPLRIQIVEALAAPRTVKEVAARLDMTATKLYYHVNLLEKHGIIQVVETHIVSGIIEKKYQVSAYSFEVDDSLFNVGDAAEANVDMVLNALFDTARQQIKESVQAKLMSLADDAQVEQQGMLLQSLSKLTPAEFQAMNVEIKGIIKKYCGVDRLTSTNPEQREYGITMATYPIKRGEG